MQSEFVLLPEQPRGNVERALLELAEKLDRKHYTPPDFQRPFVWNDKKVRSWGRSIISQQGIGAIVTYQLKGGGPIFLADGYQRLTATNLFIQNPEAYGFSFGTEQARYYCDSFPITVQHRLYGDHKEAMEAFHNLNKGTTLNPKEYCAGILQLDPRGKIVASRVPPLVFSYEMPTVTNRRPMGRNDESKFTRDAYALFLQYITETTQLDFWGVSSPKVDEVTESVEYHIVTYFNENKVSSSLLEKKIGYFDQYIAERTAEIRQTIRDVGCEGKTMSRTVMRWLLHLAIWRKNANRQDALYLEFLKKFLETTSVFPTFTSRFPVYRDDKSEPVKMVSLQSGVLKDITTLCVAFGIPLYEGYKRKNRPPAARGYHHSHKKEFAKNGEGETFFEPGPRNRSRGANPA